MQYLIFNASIFNFFRYKVLYLILIFQTFELHLVKSLMKVDYNQCLIHMTNTIIPI